MIAVNNPTPLHYDNNNFGMTYLVMYDVNENLHTSYDGNGHHVLVGQEFMGGMLFDTDPGGIVIIGDYWRILHGNCAIFPSKMEKSNK